MASMAPPGVMSGPPPLPPGMSGAASQAPTQPPSMMQLAGMSGDQTPMMTSGQSQVSEAIIRMGAEIDQALKLLAQALPPIAPWVEKTVMELRTMLGQALQAGAQPTNPEPVDNERFPDGGARL